MKYGLPQDDSWNDLLSKLVKVKATFPGIVFHKLTEYGDVTIRARHEKYDDMRAC